MMSRGGDRVSGRGCAKESGEFKIKSSPPWRGQGWVKKLLII